MFEIDESAVALLALAFILAGCDGPGMHIFREFSPQNMGNPKLMDRIFVVIGMKPVVRGSVVHVRFQPFPIYEL